MRTMKEVFTIPVGFECYKLGEKYICVRRSSCFFCRWCKLVAYDKTSIIKIVQCKHDEQWKKEDLTDKGICGKCSKWEQK